MFVQKRSLAPIHMCVLLLMLGFKAKLFAKPQDKQQARLGVELSTIFVSKHIWHGFDLLDDHGAFIPIVGLNFGDTGFSGKIIGVQPLSSGLERSVELNYAAFYTGAFWQDTRYTTNFTLNYFYYGKPNVGARKSDTQEVGAYFCWPKLIKAGNKSIVPSYYVGSIWPTKSHSNLRKISGFIHVFGLGYDFSIPDFWSQGQQQPFRLFTDITYNDGFARNPGGHDWSHCTVGISTTVNVGKVTMTPTLSYQISMDDEVNKEDEFWSGVNLTYRF